MTIQKPEKYKSSITVMGCCSLCMFSVLHVEYLSRPGRMAKPRLPVWFMEYLPFFNVNVMHKRRVITLDLITHDQYGRLEYHNNI